MPVGSKKSESTEQKLMQGEVKVEYLNVSASRSVPGPTSMKELTEVRHPDWQYVCDQRNVLCTC